MNMKPSVTYTENGVALRNDVLPEEVESHLPIWLAGIILCALAGAVGMLWFSLGWLIADRF